MVSPFSDVVKKLIPSLVDRRGYGSISYWLETMGYHLSLTGVKVMPFGNAWKVSNIIHLSLTTGELIFFFLAAKKGNDIISSKLESK